MSTAMGVSWTGTDSITGVLPSGVRTHHWPCPSPRRAIVLFQHGFGDYSRRWISDYPFFLRDLHARNIEVWAMDMWGHGDSPGQRSIVHVGKAMEDHITLRGQLTREYGCPIVLLGHSLGGLVTAASASMSPKNITGTILLAPALSKPMTPVLKGLVEFASWLCPQRQIFLKPADVHTLSRNEEFVRRWEVDEKVFHGQISYLLAASALDVAAELWSRLDQWETPLLVVHGNMDTYTDHHQSHKLIESISAKEKRLHLIDQGRHDLFSDTDAAKTWEDTIDWIDHLLRSY